jgi:hypothetical protein
LPANLQYIEHRINGFRRHLEDEVSSKKGSVGIVDTAAINSACKWDRHGLLTQHWLRHEAENLSAGDRLKFSESIAKALDNRDKNLRMLGLDAVAPAPWMIDGKNGEPINNDGNAAGDGIPLDPSQKLRADVFWN